LVVLANSLLVDPLDLQYKTTAASVKQVSKRRGENTNMSQALSQDAFSSRREDFLVAAIGIGFALTELAA